MDCILKPNPYFRAWGASHHHVAVSAGLGGLRGGTNITFKPSTYAPKPQCTNAPYAPIHHAIRAPTRQYTKTPMRQYTKTPMRQCAICANAPYAPYAPHAPYASMRQCAIFAKREHPATDHTQNPQTPNTLLSRPANTMRFWVNVINRRSVSGYRRTLFVSGRETG